MPKSTQLRVGVGRFSSNLPLLGGLGAGVGCWSQERHGVVVGKAYEHTKYSLQRS